MRLDFLVITFFGGGIFLVNLHEWLNQYVANKDVFSFAIYFTGGFALAMLAQLFGEKLGEDGTK